jgi:hypothetical protein
MNQSSNVDLLSKGGVVPPNFPPTAPPFTENTSSLRQAKLASMTPNSTPEYHSIHTVFKLPITYLNNDYIHPLSPTVAKDLELITTTHGDSTPIYDLLFLPKHTFAKEMTKEWSKQYTNHIPFLEESQRVLRNCEEYIRIFPNKYTVDCERIVDIWDSVRNDAVFLEKYSYMEWQMLMYLNKSSAFLQCLSLIQFISPLTSVLIPIMFLIFPFVILKLQSIPIDFAKYIEVLKEVAKHHFIGKTLVSMEQSSMNNVAYVLMTAGLYFLQIYQNIVSFFRFYRNINAINQRLVDIKNYVGYSIGSMEAFLTANEKVSLYTSFCDDVTHHCRVLKELYVELSNIEPSALGMKKMNQLGYMMRCYHELYDNDTYADSISYSAGFEGYINNLLGVYENMRNGNLSVVQYNNNNEVEFREQYYPVFLRGGHHGEKYITNNCKFDKNMIITGVNASGKTTVLKTTTINVIFSQQVGYGFFKSCALCPYTHIHSYLNIPDTSGRDSLFQAESRRCKEILDIIGVDKKNTQHRHFCIFDELYSGTNPIEATKSAYAFLLYLSEFNNVDFMLTTHYTSICTKFQKSKHIRNYRMDVERTEEGKLNYKYKIQPGICRIQGAIEILKSMDYPAEIIHNIRTYKEDISGRRCIGKSK